MANINKKVINLWDGGVKTSSRSSNPDTSDGAQVIKGFDIYKDPKKMLPMQTWTDFTTTAERAYEIRAIGGLSGTIYGVGKGIKGWYSAEWSHRLKVTATSLVVSGGLPFYVNMSDLPDEFWDNVQSDGSDIRATNSEGVTGQPVYFENFDVATKTGQLWINSINAEGDSFYIYWGNPTVSQIPNNAISGFQNQPSNTWTGTSMDWAYTFPNDVYNRTIGAGSEEFTTEPSYQTGLFGKAIQTHQGVIETDTDDEVALTGSNISFSFLIFIDETPASETVLFTDNNNTWSISLSTSNYIKFFVHGTAGNTTRTSTNQLNVGQWHVIDCVFTSDHYIYVDSVQEYWDSNDGNYDDIVSNNSIHLRTDTNGSSFCRIAQFWAFDNDLSQLTVTAKYNNFTDNANFWTIGSAETFAALPKQYEGLQVYSKLISSGDWSEYIVSGQPARDETNYAVNGFVEVSGDIYFISSQEENEGGFLFLSKTDTFNIMDESHLLLNTNQESYKTTPSKASPSDNAVYFTHSSQSIGSVGDPGVEIEQTFSGGVQSIVPWRTYLAAAYTRRNRGYIDIWDLVTTIVERVDLGTGNARIVGNASDLLFAVVDNFTDDTIKSTNKPTIEVKQYVGDGQAETTHVLEIPASITSYDDYWERMVSTFSMQRNTQTLFYMRIPKDSTATTFDEGFWSIGKNSRGQLALALQISTEGLGMPENVFGFAQQLFFLQKDGNIKRLSDDTYTNTSLFTTLKMNEGNTEIEKKLHGIEIITEPLEAGQTVSIYYRIQGQTTRTKIVDFTGENEFAYEATFDSVGSNLPNYNEIEFDIESTGGKSAILEYNYRYEYLSEII